MTCTAEKHGDYNAYRNAGCRCAGAVAAHCRAQKRWRLRRIRAGGGLMMLDAVGYTRRMRALVRIGWPVIEIVRRYGSDRRTLELIALGKAARVRRETAATIVRAFDELCTEDGPSRRARLRAERALWSGPEAWTDESIDDPDAEPITEVVDAGAVELAVAGGRNVRLVRDIDRAAAVAAAFEAGLAPSIAAKRLHMSYDAVRALWPDEELSAAS